MSATAGIVGVKRRHVERHQGGAMGRALAGAESFQKRLRANLEGFVVAL